MINRRILRIKAMQALFAFLKSENDSIDRGEEILFSKIESIYDLYIYILTLFIEIQEYAEQKTEECKQKRLPTEEDLNPNMRFVNNRVVIQLRNNIYLKDNISKRTISWANDIDLIKKLYQHIAKNSDVYNKYMCSENDTHKNDRNFIIAIFTETLLNNQLLIDFLDEKNVFAPDDYELVATAVIKTIKLFDENSDENTKLLTLYKNKEEDIEFVKELFRKTILYSDDFEKIIVKRTEKWEADRVAFMDMLLMKMVVCEFLKFPTIPIRATMDEYIDISKSFSTPKSSMFINGVIDKLIDDLKSENLINKHGRGMIEK